MSTDVRLGVEPPAPAPPRSAKALALAGALIVLAAGGAWLVGVFGDGVPTTTVAAPLVTITTTAGPTTTLPADDLLAAARLFWTAVGAGDVTAATGAFPATGAAAADLIAFAAAFRPAFTVGECREFAANAVECPVTVGNGDLLSIGSGTADEMLLVQDDGWLEVPAVLGSAAARLSLYALDAHTEELRAACPLTDNYAVLRLPIVGSATAACGGYLAGLIPEYLSTLGYHSGPRD
ncbi:MAG: hypothetical protein JW785_08730 [Acidimicrobiia bacterium]|nr:hypothetical protein [Acidimicrobiia bacterium]